MSQQSFFIPGPLPGANDIIRKHHMIYSRLKLKWGIAIGKEILVAKLKRVTTCRISFVWQEKHGRRDDDNVMFGQKFVLDALRDTKIIPDDRRAYVLSLTHRVVVAPDEPGVLVTIEAVP
jgi:Holliday junction resolvase RusA-like endonuclease